MQIINNVALISINETLFVQLVSFLFFVFIMNRIMFRPLKSTMDERDQYLKTLGQEIYGTKKETEELIAQLRKTETTLRNKALAAQLALIEEGNREAAQIHADFESEVAALKRKAQEEVNAQVAEARKHLQEESKALAVGIMEKILDRRLAA
jgi:F-type H+-transporting ATPase subunit b